MGILPRFFVAFRNEPHRLCASLSFNLRQLLPADSHFPNHRTCMPSHNRVCTHLVHVKGHVLTVLLTKLLVLAREDNLRNPRRQRSRNRESSGRAKRDNVAWTIRLGP